MPFALSTLKQADPSARTKFTSANCGVCHRHNQCNVGHRMERACGRSHLRTDGLSSSLLRRRIRYIPNFVSGIPQNRDEFKHKRTVSGDDPVLETLALHVINLEGLVPENGGTAPSRADGQLPRSSRAPCSHCSLINHIMTNVERNATPSNTLLGACIGKCLTLRTPTSNLALNKSFHVPH